MSAETESIILGAIALVAGVGTAVAVRKRTARVAVGCCIVGGIVLLLYGGMDRDSRLRGGDAEWRDRQERLRVNYVGEVPAEQPQELVVLPNGTVVRSNALNLNQGVRGGALQGKNAQQGVRGAVGAFGDDSNRGKGKRRLPSTKFDEPQRDPTNGSNDPQKQPSDQP